MKDSITAAALRCAEEHMKACEDWNHGQIKGSWLDADGNLCIQYEDGCWWHYRETESGLQWW